MEPNSFYKKGLERMGVECLSVPKKKKKSPIPILFGKGQTKITCVEL